MASAAIGQVFLIPAFLDESNLQVIPPSVLDSVKQCQAFFVENERSARRYLKLLWKEMVIDDFEWHVIHKVEETARESFRKLLQRGAKIGIISEAGCPGVADPGQVLVATAHSMGAAVRPLAGPSAILLALMGSGLNGQRFQFSGYLPIDNGERTKAIKELESESARKQCTQIFMETPYRNNQLLESILQTCHPATQLCLAVDITGVNEFVMTRSVGEWKKNIPDINKRPAIFLIYAG